MSKLSEQASNAIMYTTYSAFLVFGLAVAWRLRGQTKGQFLSANRTQTAIPLCFNFLASTLGSGILYGPAQLATIGGVHALITNSIGAAFSLMVLAIFTPIIRRKCPEGFVLTEWTRVRYGPVTAIFVSIITLLTLFLWMVGELSGIRQVVETLTGLNGLYAVIVQVTATSIYTAAGGFKVSFITDNVQGAMFLCLAVIAIITMAVKTRVDPSLVGPSGYLKTSLLGWQLLYITFVSSALNNFLLAGWWMRAFAAKTDRDLWIGTWAASILTFLIVVGIGCTGLLAGLSGLLGNPPQSSSVAFFVVLEQLPAWMVGVVLFMSCTVSTATFDSLQSAMISTASNDMFRNRLNLWYLRIAVVVVIVPVVVVALKADSVVTIFFISNLVSSTTVPAWMVGLSDRCYAWRGFEVVVGGLGGFLSVFLFGLVYYDGDTSKAGGLLLLQEGLYDPGWAPFGTFVAAPVGGFLFALAAFACRIGVQWIIAKKNGTPFTALDRPITPEPVIDRTSLEEPTVQDHDTYTDNDGVEHSTVTIHGKFF